MLPTRLFVRARILLCVTIAILFAASAGKAQMRQLYIDSSDINEIVKLSFFSPSEGYIAASANYYPWIGYTTDSGRTFIKKKILNNFNWVAYPVNLTFALDIKGVKAFDKNKILVYGNLGSEPSILYSSDAGNSFTLVHWSAYTGSVTNGIKDMIFPENSNTGYAIDDNRILKTTNQGLSWSVIASFPGKIFTNLEAVDNNNVFVLSTGTSAGGLLKTTNGGSSWQEVVLPVLPERAIMYAHFISASTGWADISGRLPGDRDTKYYFYKTTDGGNSWSMLNNAITSFRATKIKFIDSNTGYAIDGALYKTVNGGKIWERLPRDNNMIAGHNDLQCISASQLWAGGWNDLLEISTNGGGTPLPAAFCSADTTGLRATGKVSLINYSRTDYTYQWFVNKTLAGTTYNASYTHDPNSVTDTIVLVVSNGSGTDTSLIYQDFYPRVRVTSFTPQSGGSLTQLTIHGNNLMGAHTVSVGGIPVAAFTVVSASEITATIANGASGFVKVITGTGSDSLAGFSFIPSPVISSFTPAAAAAGTVVTITGNHFSGATGVSFDGIPAVSFTVVSVTTITAVAPSGGSGAVSITTAGGITALTGYISLPTVLHFSPASGTQGATLQISGTSFNGATAVSVGGVPVLSFIVNNSNSITASVGSGGSGPVMVSTPGGSSLLPGYTWFTTPVITSFSPAAGPAGTNVTITGKDFNSVAANNIVYFGAARATVTAGNTNALTVTVPPGATYEPISVLNNNTNLAGYSVKPFLLTYPGGNISGHTYETRTTMHPNYTPMFVSLGDLDADGKTDLIVSATGGNGEGEVLLYRNTSTVGSAVFDTPVSIPHVGFRQATASDLDGDGKLDLVILSSDGAAPFLNTSTLGNISFSAAPELEGNKQFNQNRMALADADGDGKPDLVISNGLMYRNTSTPGNISFDKSVMVFSTSRNVLLVDISGDDKPDLIFSDNDNTFYVLKNKCTKGALAFEAPVVFTGFNHTCMVAGDVDGDGKTDLVSADYYQFKIGIALNTSSGNNISFDPMIEMPAPQSPFGIALGDIDGDGKPDIAATLQNYNIAAFRNTSSAGAISFLPPIHFIPGTFYGDHIVALGDLDGDGKNDAVTSTLYAEGLVSVHLNTYSTTPSIESFTPAAGRLGDTITIKGTNFTGASAVQFGNTTAASFIVESAMTIKAVLGNGTSGNVSVTTATGTASDSGFTYLPSIASFTPVSGGAGTVVTITGVGFTGATNVSFGGAAAVSFAVISNTSITAVIGTGASGKLEITKADGTAISGGDFTFIPAIPPVITSVTPVAADRGATITISGSNFSNSTTGNDVYFGTIKATVVTATSNTLTVIVPNGAVYEHIMVTTHYLTAISPKPFVTTFAGSPGFSASSFSVKQDVPAGIVADFGNIHFKDMDGDKWLDIVAPSSNQNGGFKVLRNKGGGNGLVSFDSPVYFTAITQFSGSIYGNIGVGDFDGDGKPDIAQLASYARELAVRRNISTGSQIKFDTAVIFKDAYIVAGGGIESIAVNDINHDGKPDIIMRNPIGVNIEVYMNATVGASIVFEPPIEIALPLNVATVQVEDIDNDQLPDLIATAAVTGSPSLPSIYVFRNTSAGNNISFETPVSFGTFPAYYLLIGDLDGDSKPEIVLNDYLGLHILRNTSTPGNIAFTTGARLTVSHSYFLAVGMNDLNGDGRPDILLTQSDLDSVTVYPNTSTTGSIAFGNRYSYYVGKSPDAVVSGDVDGDGKPDIAVVVHQLPYPNDNVIAVLKNNTTSITEKQVCAGANTNLQSTVTGTVYQWQQNTGNGFADVLDNSIISGSKTAQLQFTSIPVTYNGYQYQCITDGRAAGIVSLNVTAQGVAPTVTISTADTSVCTAAAVVFTATPSGGVGSPSYQWQVNGIATGNNSTTFSTSSLVNNSQVICAMKSTGTGICGTTVTVNSNAISMKVNNIIPIVTISGNTTVIKDSTATISAVITDGGVSPVYKWQDSTSNHGWQDIVGASGSVLSYKPFLTGDKIITIITSNAVCVHPATVKSNVLSFVVNAGGGTNPVPGGNGGVRMYPNPVTSVLTIDSLQIADEWQTLDIVSVTGTNRVISVDISGQTSVSISVVQLPPGQYVAVLRSKSKPPLYLRFLKL